MKHFAKHRSQPLEFIEDETKELRKEYGRLRKFSDENSLIVGVIALGVAALVVVSTLYWVYVTEQNAALREDQHIQQLSRRRTTSLERASNGTVEVTVKNVTTNSDADPAFGVSDDMTMLIMQMTIKNLSRQTQQLIPAHQLYVRSSEGDYQSLHASMHVTAPIPMKDLRPGESVSGEVSFAVPKRLDTPLVYVDTGWNASLPLVIDVQH